MKSVDEPLKRLDPEAPKKGICGSSLVVKDFRFFERGSRYLFRFLKSKKLGFRLSTSDGIILGMSEESIASYRSWPRLRRLDWRSTLADILLISIAIFLVGQGYLRPGIPLSDDLHGSQMMDAFFQRKALFQEGMLSSWDYSGGTPMGFFHPLPVSYLTITFFHLFLGLFAATRIAVLFLLVISASGMYVFLRSLSGSRLAAVVGGLFYVWARPNIIEHIAAGHIDMTCVLAIFPFFFFLLERSLQRKSKRLAVFNGILFALMFASDLQIFIFVNLIMAVYIIFRSFILRRASLADTIRQHGIIYLLTWGVGTLLCAYTLLTIVGYKPYYAFHGYSGHWKHIFSVGLGPALGLWSRVWQYLIVAPQSIQGLEGINLLYGWHLLFIVPALLFYRRAPVLFAASLYVVSLFLVMGVNTPLLPLLYKLPVFKYFRVPIRFYFLTVFALSILLALSCAALPRLFRGVLSRRVAALLLSAAALLLTLGVGNPPYVWEMFRTYRPPSMGMDLRIYDYLNSQNDSYGIESLPFMTTGSDRDAKTAAYYHGRRSYNGSHWHMDSREVGALKEFVNYGLESERLPTLLGVFNVGYLYAWGREWSGAFHKLANLELVSLPGGASKELFYNRRVLPFVRTVGNCVLLPGEEGHLLAEDIFNSAAFDPAKTVLKYAPAAGELGSYDMALVGRRQLVFGYDNAVYMPHLRTWRDDLIAEDSTFERRGEGAVFKTVGRSGSHNSWTLQLDGLELAGECQIYFSASGSANAGLGVSFSVDGVEKTVPSRIAVNRISTELVTYKIDLTELVKAYAGRLTLRALQLVLVATDEKPAELYLEDIGLIGPGWSRSLRSSLRGRGPEFDARYVARAAPQIKELEEHRYTGRYKVEVECPEDIGYLVIAEPWYPSWQVKIDGKRVQPFRAYTALLGIELKGAGAHTVEVWHGTIPWQLAGALISLLTLLAVIGYLLWPVVRRRKSRLTTEPQGSRRTPFG